MANPSGIFTSFLAYFFRKIPGGLAITTMFWMRWFFCGSGSSVVCAATLSRIAIPEMLKYGYKPEYGSSVSCRWWHFRFASSQ